MELSEIIPHIEALIFASEKPLTSLEIVELINNAFGFMEERVSLEQIESSIEGIKEKYASEFYPFEIRESGGGWQFLTKKEFHKTIIQLNGDKFLKRLSNAALETLAIIAYKQPITKGEVESIRGVNSDYSVQKLLEKELIIITGRNEKLPGHPIVYTTSKTFMDYFGINSTEDLPKIREVLAEQMIDGTFIDPADFTSNTDIAASQDTIAEEESGILVEESEETSGDDALNKEEEILEEIEEKLIAVHLDDEGNIDVEVLHNEEGDTASIIEGELTDSGLNEDTITIDEDLLTDEGETALIIDEELSDSGLNEDTIVIDQDLLTEEDEIVVIVEEESNPADVKEQENTDKEDRVSKEDEISPSNDKDPIAPDLKDAGTDDIDLSEKQ